MGGAGVRGCARAHLFSTSDVQADGMKAAGEPGARTALTEAGSA